MKILVTGFDPFGQDKVNPSWQAVDALADAIDDIEVLKLLLPTAFKRSKQLLISEISKQQPDAVLCVGLAGGRSAVSIEKVAINYADAGIPDNDGNQPKHEKLDQKGPAAYFASLPVDQLLQALHAHELPAELSLSAGAYVCNATMYQLLNYLARQNLRTIGGFVHLPFTPEMRHEDQASLPLAIDEQALGTIISSINYYLKEEKHD